MSNSTATVQYVVMCSANLPPIQWWLEQIDFSPKITATSNLG